MAKLRIYRNSGNGAAGVSIELDHTGGYISPETTGLNHVDRTTKGYRLVSWTDVFTLDADFVNRAAWGKKVPFVKERAEES